MARTSPWPTLVGAAALIALPVLATAQTSGSSTQTPQTPTTQQQPGETANASTPDEHLSAAKQTLNSIPRAAVTGRNAAKMNDVRRHFAALEKSYSAKASGSATGSAARSTKSAKSGDWNTHLMALDRALSDLLGSSTGAAPEATGTSGAAAVDSDVRVKLEEFRTHITQFAAAASGTSASGSMSSPSASAPSSSTSSTGAPASTTPSEPAQTAQSTSSQSSSQPQTPPTSTSSTTAAGSQTTGTATGSTPATAQADTSAAREHLTQARQSLADLTAMPQAQQLQGETRNKVSQLISQFNQLITTQGDWRSAYNEVNTTLTALLSASASASGSASSSTSGAVGTSGTAAATGSATLDPALRSKLEEFRTRLEAFHTAAGGSAEGSAGSTGSMSSTGSSPAGSTSTGSMSSSSSAPAPASGDAETHIAAIERILDEASGSSTSGSAASTGTSGTPATGSASAGATGTVTLDRAKLEQIRTHLQQLRQAIRK